MGRKLALGAAIASAVALVALAALVPVPRAAPIVAGASASAIVEAAPSPPAPSAAAPASAATRFDVHTHVMPEVYAPARAFLVARGIGRAVNLSGGQAGLGLEESIAASKQLGDFFVVFANLRFQGIGTPGWAEREVAQLERAKALGARGLKVQKSLGLSVRFPDGKRVPVDSPVLDPVFDAAGRLGFPVAIHTGDPRAFFQPATPDNERWDELQAHPSWSFADRALFPRWSDLVDELERRVARSPRTTFVGVHFGNAPEDPSRVARMLRDHPNLWIDTAARVPELGRKPADVRRTILEHQDRVLFGTDLQFGLDHLVLGAGEPRMPARSEIDRFFSATWRFFETDDRRFEHPTPIQGRWTIDGIGLPKEILEKIYRGNAERLLGTHLSTNAP